MNKLKHTEQEEKERLISEIMALVIERMAEEYDIDPDIKDQVIEMYVNPLLNTH